MTHSNPLPADNSPDPAFGEVPPAHGYSTPPPSAPAYPLDDSGYDSGPYSKSGEAKQQASEVAGGAADAGKHVAGVTQDQAQQVAGEAKNQAKDLLNQTRGELTDQAATQQKRVASGLRALGDELGSMAQSSDNPGLATDLVRQASDRTSSIASWLDNREPGHVLDEVTGFARRRPGAFLALAAGAGLLAGRLGRGVLADSKDDSGSGAGQSATQAPMDERRVVPASEQFGQYSSDAASDFGSPPPAERPIGTPQYTAQPEYGIPTTQYRAPSEDPRA